MTADTFTLVFAVSLVLSLALRFWLSARQIRHVARHRDTVPAAFAGSVSIEAHRKAADYTIAKARFSQLSMAFGAVVLLGWTLFGGLDALDRWLRGVVVPLAGSRAYEVALVMAVVAIGALVDLPFEMWSTFRLEQRFGFNRMTWRLYLSDLVKGAVIALLIGTPIAAAILGIMAAAGSLWWLWAWIAWTVFMVLALVVVPTFIAPLFNRFEPLADASLRERVEALMARAGFAAKGLFVMDGSRRSAHANAYFTGLGRAKRVVFYDTLLARLVPAEVEAVLAHELGHFRLRHIGKRIASTLAISFLGFALLGWLASRSWFYAGLGVAPSLSGVNNALALVLFMLVVPVYGVFLSPLLSGLSRRHEFEADAYASRLADGGQLASALLKLHADNATTLTPDPLVARFYYSHPPAAERLAALAAATAH
ncbi:M48 family metallopeptidase [Piscinibacter koreensis]|uniref:M48 family metallopeptidase n=1 Tax=Piscinibacter koreensis TaxID=2742824 RepID=A0A7Y6TXI9_9BURK|nr:M48 family metallopeptidase [Schlegelella koreensis]NUZ07115.1 M48 family metallopeptidase [Schlegelella koreensis]